MYTLIINKNTGDIRSVGGASYEYSMQKLNEINPDLIQIKVDDWPDDPETPGRHVIIKKIVQVDINTIKDVKAKKDIKDKDGKIIHKKGDVLYKTGTVKRKEK